MPIPEPFPPYSYDHSSRALAEATLVLCQDLYPVEIASTALTGVDDGSFFCIIVFTTVTSLGNDERTSAF